MGRWDPNYDPRVQELHGCPVSVTLTLASGREVDVSRALLWYPEQENPYLDVGVVRALVDAALTEEWVERRVEEELANR